jgi:pantoate--beta-alanine ligase
MTPTSISPLPVARTLDDLRWQVFAWRTEGMRVGLVPTMGALHEGHLSLVKLALENADRVVVSLFVNPAQFAPHEDFDTYPRAEGRDAALLAGAGCHLLYAPNASEVYPPGFSTTITVAGVSAPLEGERRPQFFGGVATVVAKLLIQVSPDVAVFGEKDYQQLQVIKRMARDLDLPARIIGAPTRRAEDGLALSSRNAYLSEDERAVAGRLNGILARMALAVGAGSAVNTAEAIAADALMAAGFSSIDYIEVRHAETLASLGPGPIGDAPARVLAAVWLGKTRLIDNMAV